jgi:hypothetical protein
MPKPQDSNKPTKDVGQSAIDGDSLKSDYAVCSAIAQPFQEGPIR